MRGLRLSTGLAGAAAMIAAVTVLSRVLGFGRYLVQEGSVGHGLVGSAYNAANTLPNVLFEVAAGGALAGAVVPLLAGPLARRARGEVDRIASALLGWSLLVLVPLAVALALLAGPIGAWLGADEDSQRLIARFVVVFAAQVPLYGLAVVLSGVLQAQRAFFWPAFVPVLSTVVVMGSYLAYAVSAGGERTGLTDAAFDWLAWGTTAGVAALSLPLLVPVLRSGVRLRPRLDFPSGVATRAKALAGAGIGALLAQQGAVLVLLKLALTAGGEGTNTVYIYTQAVYLLPYAVLAVPLATSTFPRIAARVAAGDGPGLRHLAAVSTRGIVAVSALGVAALVAAAPAVSALFAALKSGGDPALIEAMAPALTWMSPGVLGFALVFHVSRVLYTLDRGRQAVLATATGWVVVIAAALVLVRILVPDGTDGPRALVALSAATALGMLVAGGSLLVGLRAAAGRDALAGLARTGLVLLPATLAGAGLGRLLADGTLGGLGDGVVGAAVAGAGAGAAALVVVGGAVALLDRTMVTQLRHLDRVQVTS